jgi:hypothetical protein
MIPSFSTNFGSRKLIYALDMPSFQRDFASLKTLDHGTGPAITFTRASGATYFDADGVLQTAATNAPRFDHDPAAGALSRGLLIEESRTNSLRNSQAGGAATGTPGTLPTNWAAVETPESGITREIVAAGTAGGLNYIDYRLSGTAALASGYNLRFDGSTQVVVSPSQVWTGSVYLAVVGGSATGVSSVVISLIERTADGTLIESTSSGSLLGSISANLQRYSITRTMGATAARAQTGISLNIPNGITIDITLRIAAPQLEQGAFATSYIPTTTTAATRAADSAVVTPIASFYNASEGTLFAEWRSGQSLTGGRVFALNDNTVDNVIELVYANVSGLAGAFFFTRVASTNKATAPTSNPAPVANTDYILIGSYSPAGVFASRGGATAVASDNGEYPLSLTHATVGSTATGARLNGHIRKIAYWPKRLTNELLEQLTT